MRKSRTSLRWSPPGSFALEGWIPTLTPTLAEVRKGSLGECKFLRPKVCCSFSYPVGDSGGPLIIHKRSRFIQVSLLSQPGGGGGEGDAKWLARAPKQERPTDVARKGRAEPLP